MRIWKRHFNHIMLEKDCNKNVATEVPYYMGRIDIGKGFEAIVLQNGETSEVYEVLSGSFVGYSIDQVREDVKRCDDIEFLKKQIEEERNIGKEAELVDIETFMKM